MAYDHTQERRLIWSADEEKFVVPVIGDLESRSIAGKGLRADRFLKGPVPWWWIIDAAKLSSNALIVGLSLWRLAGATKKTTVTLSSAEIEPFGIGRSAKSRAVAALEEAGLIEVVHKTGRFPIVTLVTQ